MFNVAQKINYRPQMTFLSFFEEAYLNHQFEVREAFKKKEKKSVMCNICYTGGGGRTGLRYTFFLQKHGLKWLNINI